MAKNSEVKMTDRDIIIKKIKSMAKSIVDKKGIRLCMAGFDGDITELDAARQIALDIVKLLAEPDDEPADEPCRHIFTIGIGIEESIKNRCVKCGQLIDTKKPYSPCEAEDVKEKIEAMKIDFIEEAEKCLVNLHKNDDLIKGGPDCPWIKVACDCIDALIAELKT